MVLQAIEFDPALIARYDKSGPRYTSYPTAVQFTPAFSAADYVQATHEANVEAVLRPLSLYVHIPFCDTVCFYCGCNKVVTKLREKAIPYLEHLFREIELQAALFSRRRIVTQLHWGGGTPTFLGPEQMQALMAHLRRHFNFAGPEEGEFSIEIDPREVDAHGIQLLRHLGFNRISMGVQDFNPTVQRAVNRIQSTEQTLAVMAHARQCGFKSINVDLIYGLPLQTVASFLTTLETVLAAQPGRLSIFNYAHMPELFKPQRRINAEDLPPATEKLAILRATIDRLTEAGYVYIGMDHFAKPDDELAIAQRQGTLYRNFQGYSTHRTCDLVALGITAISMVGPAYAQNVRTLEEYYDVLAFGRLPVYRGIRLNADDLLRRGVITQLICHFELDTAQWSARCGIDFMNYFREECDALRAMAGDGLLELGPVIRVLPRGRLLIRNICMVFDRYLHAAEVKRYSKVI